MARFNIKNIVLDIVKMFKRRKDKRKTNDLSNSNTQSQYSNKPVFTF